MINGAIEYQPYNYYEKTAGAVNTIGKNIVNGVKHNVNGVKQNIPGTNVNTAKESLSDGGALNNALRSVIKNRNTKRMSFKNFEIFKEGR